MGKVYGLKGEKRRGGARDDSELYIDYTLDELMAMLERRRRRSEELEKQAAKKPYVSNKATR